MKTKGLIYLLSSLAFTILSCKNQASIEGLIPNNIGLAQTETISTGISILKQYTYKSEIDSSDLIFCNKQFSNNEKVFSCWKTISKKEKEDIINFLNYEYNSSSKIRRKISSYLKKDHIYIAYLYDRDKGPYGSDKYKPSDWIDLYLLDEREKKILWLSYGGF